MTIRLVARKGFTIPMTLLFSTIMVLTLAASFTLISTERHVNDGYHERAEAFAIAEGALQTYLTNRSSYGYSGVPSAVPESVRITMTHGYADVILQRMRPAVGTAPAVYLVRSRGTSTISHVWTPGLAQHTVAEVATWQAGSMSALGAWTSITGLTKNGGSGTLTGVNQCAGGPNVAGVAVPSSPGYSQKGGKSVPTGSPAVDSLGTEQQAANSVKIDWNGIVNQNAITPTVSMPGGSWPSFADTSYWPVIMATGDFSLPSSGRGLLIVTGNLTISGSSSWNGVVLVGGNLTSNGNNTVAGAIVSGLNVKILPQSQWPPTGAIGNGTKTFAYNSCYVTRALSGLGSLKPLQNAWLDNWSNY